jgi:hypothetical protein
MSSTTRWRRAITCAVLVVGAIVATAAAPGAAPTTRLHPKFDPKSFVDTVDNPYFPLVPGTRWVYEGDTDAGHERVETEVTHETKDILSVTTIVVRDKAFVDGELIEDTRDWYAQDRAGNVWYMGEATQEYEHGTPTNTKGSWEAGVKGAKPGIQMPAKPRPGTSYRQEYLKGEAEDEATILANGAKATVPAGAFSSSVKTKDYTRLEPKLLEHKYYAPGVGLVLEDTKRGGFGRLELIEHTSPASG